MHVASARTLDLKLVEYRNRSQVELAADDIFEMHAARIGPSAYASMTGNHAGANQMAGFTDYLVPMEVAKDAASPGSTAAKTA